MSSVWQRLRLWARQRRYLIRRDPKLHLIYRLAVGVVGTIVLAAGIVAIPYPGPGWLIVFLGLGILASEFAWAHRLLTFARRKYDAWMEWIKRQPVAVQATVWMGTAAIVLVTLWLIGALHMVAGWLNIDAQWLASPILGG
ncbi:TIGR02611 family protein [Gordonia sp. NPDC003424]